MIFVNSTFRRCFLIAIVRIFICASTMATAFCTAKLLIFQPNKRSLLCFIPRERREWAHNLVPRVSHLAPPGGASARGETLVHAGHVPLWHWKLQGGVLCNQAIGHGELSWIQNIALCCERHYPRCLTELSFQDEISKIIYANVYLKVKQVSFKCARPDWCKRHNNVSR